MSWRVERVVEGVLGGTILATQKLIDAGIAVGRCFRGLGSDWDTTPEGPEWLAEKEAEEEVAEPTTICMAERPTAPHILCTKNTGHDGRHGWVSDGQYWDDPSDSPGVLCSCDICHPIDCSDAASVVPPRQMPDADGDASPEHPSPSASPLTWAEWAVPAILTELDKHAHVGLKGGEGSCDCCFYDGVEMDYDAWAAHVAPHIAARLERATLAEFPKTDPKGTHR